MQRRKPTDEDVFEAVQRLIDSGQRAYLYRVRELIDADDCTNAGGFRLVPTVRRLERAGRVRLVRGGVAALVEIPQATT